MRRGVGARRQGPGVVRTVARTAVVAGTATAVSRSVSNSMDARAAQQQQEQLQREQQQQAVNAPGAQPGAYAPGAYAPNAYAPGTYAPDAYAPGAQPVAQPGPATDATIAQLQQLADLQKQGILTPEEFAQQKARILGTGG